jgi:hypothetical protein
MAKKHPIFDRLDPYCGQDNQNTLILTTIRLNKKQNDKTTNNYHTFFNPFQLQ